MSENLPVSTAGLPVVSGPPSPSEWNAMRQQAEVIARSGMAPRAVNTPEKVLVIAMKGRELQVPPMQALSHIHIVEGKPTLSAELMIALVQRAGHKLRVIETSSDSCTVEGVRRDDPSHPSRVTFSMEDARKAGVANKNVWKNYPAAMLRARAISALCRFNFADVLMGASYTPEELGAEVGEDGEVVTSPEVNRWTDAQESSSTEAIEEAQVVDHPSRPDRPRGQSSSGKRETGRSDKLTNDQAKKLAELAVEFYGEQGVRELQMKVLKGKQITTLNRQNANKVIAGLEAKIQSRDGYDDEDDEDEAELATEESTSGVEGLSDVDMSDIESIFEQQEQDSENDEDGPPARKSQIDLLKALIVEEHGEGAVEKFNERTGRKLDELNRAEADQMIDMLTPEDA